MTPEKAASAIGSVRAIAAASLLALGVVPLFASPAAAAVKPQSEIFQLVVLDDVRLVAVAHAGDNDPWKDIEQSGTVVVTNTVTDADPGHAEADSDVAVDVVQKAQASDGHTTTVVDLESNTTSVETGDASASSTSHVHVNQRAESWSQHSP